MSFYDDLGEQLKEAELLLEAEESRAPAPPARARRHRRDRRFGLPRPVALGGLAAILAIFVFVGLSTDRRASIAQAGLAIFETDAVATDGLNISPRQADLANASTAHPFDTPNGTGYAFMATQENSDDVQVCVFVPSPPGTTAEALSTCTERSLAEANGVPASIVVDAPGRSLDVIVLPVGTDTARYTPSGGGPSQTLPSVNGVVVFQPPAEGKISWEAADGSRRSEEVIRNFPETKLEARCKDGSVIYAGSEETGRRNRFCSGRGGLRNLSGVPLDKPETQARPEDRSRYAAGAVATTPTTP
ncbi:MAG: hypothetical protein Q7T55_06755 [Solirubrobacteraceae bacterium]|nr:hypothetical protein [Solirubrobacteraceae bacterium]